MTFSLFLKRAAILVAIFGFAAMITAAMNADQALIANAIVALLPIAISIVLIARIALQPRQAPQKAN